MNKLIASLLLSLILSQAGAALAYPSSIVIIKDPLPESTICIPGTITICK